MNNENKSIGTYGSGFFPVEASFVGFNLNEMPREAGEKICELRKQSGRPLKRVVIALLCAQLGVDLTPPK